MGAQQAFIAKKMVKEAYEKCQEAMPLFDELVAAVAMTGETGRIAYLSRSLCELKRQMADLSHAGDA